MPVYEYLCEQNHRTERVKKINISDRKRDNDICETCKGKAKLAPSRPAHPILVGRGFFANDYGQPTR